MKALTWEEISKLEPGALFKIKARGSIRGWLGEFREAVSEGKVFETTEVTSIGISFHAAKNHTYHRDFYLQPYHLPELDIYLYKPIMPTKKKKTRLETIIL